jgi:energy-coupling factor transport system substrate-specific component
MSEVEHITTETSEAPQVEDAPVSSPLLNLFGERSGAKATGIGVRQVVFAALGAALYAGASLATNSLVLPGASQVSLRPGIVIPLFFGAVFGPFVGLFSGLVGNSLADLHSYGSLYWNWEVGLGLVGAVTSLALIFNKGRYNTRLRIIFGVIFSLVGLVVGLGFAAISDIWVSGLTFTSALTTEFLPAVLPDAVFAIILLPILLVAYNAALSRTGR